ncbi:unnamed protein product, partial [Lepidochelys olivacea]
GITPEAQDPTLVGREHRGARLREAVASDPASEREPVPIPSPAAEFQAELRKDPSLRKLRDLADLSVGRTMRRGCQERFLWEKGFLYREWAPTREVESCGIRRQLGVPQKYRHRLLYLAHDIPLAGHQGIRRTRQRLLQNFYWPGVFTTVRQYCRSCDPCQRVGKAWDKGKAALRPLPIIEEPFQKVAMDIVGPLSRTTRSGKKYILVVVDFATRYPEAVPSASIEADTVANALLTIFSRVGFPKEVLTDQGSNFMSALLRCLWEKCGVRHDWASAYHPQSNGLVERFNGTLKMMLKTFMNQHPQDWDKYLPHLLFAYREVPQESTGFSPFELLYGRRVRGPLDLMRDEWEGKATPDGESVVEYVLIFRERLAELMGLARENLARAQRKQKVWYDRTARARAYATGDQVMVLIPVRKNKLQAAWEGPFKVVKQLNEVNYVVELSNRAHHRRVYHVNMMKPYYARGNVVLAVCGQWEEQGDDPLVDLFPGTRAGFPLETIPLSDQLTAAQQAEVRGVLHPYRQLFSNQPGRTNLTVHRVQTGSHPPIRCSPFRVTGKTAQDLEREVRDMLALGVIQPSASPWASPVVLVPKKDGSVRFCVDYRKLNAITVSDAYPMPRPDELLDKLGGARYLTTMDLTKGYWQVPLDADARLKSAFITPLGLYEFLTLPFGLKGAPATFQRLVDQLLRGMESFAVAYIDDICVFSQTWEDHVSQVRQVLDRLQGAGLTVKAEKCKVGMAEVSYLGHRVGSGRLKPEPAKVEVIRDWPAPHTKKQVQAFIGMAGYYRRFVPHFSAIATPLTELCKKGKPDKVVWTEQCQEAFRALKEALEDEKGERHPPHLFGRHFTVYTDHSPLTWLHQMKGANAKLLRWSLLLQDYDMDVVHVKGTVDSSRDPPAGVGELVQCDFDDNGHPFCRWTRPDAGDWMRTQGLAPGESPGPPGGTPERERGFTSPRWPGPRGRWSCAVWSWRGPRSSAWSSSTMYGDVAGSWLAVLPRGPAGYGAPQWNRTGLQSSAWLRGAVTLSAPPEQPFKVVFRAARTPDFDLALDSVSIRLGPCSQGYYIYAEAGSLQLGQSVSLESRDFCTADAVCVVFYCYMAGIVQTGTQLRVLARGPSGPALPLWTRTGLQSPAWLPGSASVPAGRLQPTRIVFEVVRGNLPYLDVALDNVSVRRGPCPGAPVTPPTLGSSPAGTARPNGTTATATVATGTNGNQLHSNGFRPHLWVSSPLCDPIDSARLLRPVPPEGPLRGLWPGLPPTLRRPPAQLRPALPARLPVRRDSASCVAAGDPHYTTFDKRKFDFQGTCPNVLAQPCNASLALAPFAVHAANEPRHGQGAVSYVRAVFVELPGATVALLKNHVVQVNGSQVTLPALPAPSASVRLSGTFAEVRTDFGLVVWYDGNHFAEVQVSRQYWGALCGLCGDYNGDPGNDFWTPHAAGSAGDFGDSWGVGN